MDEPRKQKILIVDDEQTNIQFLMETLGKEYKYSVALNGEQALKLAGATNPDLILLDIVMPGMDGYEVCRKLKTSQETKDIAVVFLTSLSDAEDEYKGLALGAVDYIIKPFNPSIVEVRVKNHLELIQARAELRKQNLLLKENAQLREDVERITRHDLKSPLTTVIGAASLLGRKAQLEPRHQRMLKSVEEAGYKILNMINLSLDLYKMENKVYQLCPSRVDVFNHIRQVKQDVSALLEAKAVRMDCIRDGEVMTEQCEGGTFMVKGEELLCYSMLANLLSNAVEASPEGEEVTITCEGDDEMARIVIHNRGAVPASIRDRFFEKYTTAGKSNGTGLGTYSARLIAETMRGDVAMETSDAPGEESTTVTVTLPR